MSQRESTMNHLWSLVVKAFVAGRMAEAQSYEATLTFIENTSDGDYLALPAINSVMVAA